MGSLDERVPVKWIVPGKPGDPGYALTLSLTHTTLVADCV